MDNVRYYLSPNSQAFKSGNLKIKLHGLSKIFKYILNISI